MRFYNYKPLAISAHSMTVEVSIQIGGRGSVKAFCINPPLHPWSRPPFFNVSQSTNCCSENSINLPEGF